MDTHVKKGSGLATAGMVLGIIAIVGCWIPFLNIGSIIMGVLALVFGAIALAQKRSKGKAVAAVVLGLLSIVIGIYMTVGASKAINDAAKKSTDQTDAQQKSATDEKKKLTLDDGWTLDQSNPYMTEVVGSVSNNSDKAVDGYIQITFSALDADGANVGDCLANANTVDAHGTWKFKAMCSGSDIKTVRFKELSGF